jgi:autotransporter-associated beta strand protein
MTVAKGFMKRYRNIRIAAASIAAIIGLSAPTAHAADRWWDTSNGSGLTGGDGIWSTGVNNWNTSANPGSQGRVNWTNGDTANLTATGPSVLTVSGTVQVNGINVTQTGYTIGGTTLTLGSPGIDTAQDLTIDAPLGGSVGLTKSGTATATLTASSGYTGTTTVSAGTLTLTSAGALTGSTNFSVSSGATFNVNGAIPAASNLTANGTVNFATVSPTLATLTDGGAGTRSVTVASGLTLTHTGTSVFSGAISGAGNLSKTTGGNFTLSGSSNSYSGTTSVTAGTLTVNGAITGAGGAVTVSGTGKLAGNGSIARTVSLNSGGTISPNDNGASDGSNVGKLTTNAQTWNGGATYVWEIKNAGTNNPVTDAGTSYDTLSVSGAINVSGASSGNKFTIQVISPGTGGVTGFNANSNYTWVIASGSSNVAGFTAADQFALITTDFTTDNPTADPNNFKVDVSGGSIRVTYSVPEPTAPLLLATAGGASLLRRRRHNRNKPSSTELR